MDAAYAFNNKSYSYGGLLFCILHLVLQTIQLALENAQIWRLIWGDVKIC